MWPEDREDVYQSTSELLTLYLRRRSIRQEDAATRSGVSFSTLKRILADEGPRRPTLSEIERLSANLGFSQREHTDLLGSADYYPEQLGILYLLTTWKPMLNDCAYPIHVMDLRGYVWGGNVAWQHWFGSASPPNPESSLSPADASPDVRVKHSLPGTHWLLTVFHPASRLYQAAEGISSEHWRNFAAEQMARFRVATKRFEANELMKSDAWPEGTPRWRPEVVETLSALPDGIGDFAQESWRHAQYRQDRDIGGAHPNQPRRLNYSQVRLTLGGKPQVIALLTTTMAEDSRFYCVHWIPTDTLVPLA